MAERGAAQSYGCVRIGQNGDETLPKNAILFSAVRLFGSTDQHISS